MHAFTCHCTLSPQLCQTLHARPLVQLFIIIAWSICNWLLQNIEFMTAVFVCWGPIVHVRFCFNVKLICKCTAGCCCTVQFCFFCSYAFAMCATCRPQVARLSQVTLKIDLACVCLVMCAFACVSWSCMHLHSNVTQLAHLFSCMVPCWIQGK